MEKQFIDLNKQTPPATTETPASTTTSETSETSSTSEAPATTSAPPTPSMTDNTTSTPAAEDILSETGLPAGYLAEGYCKIAGKTRYIDPDLIGARAQEIAEALAEGGLKPSGFNPILRELKKANNTNH